MKNITITINANNSKARDIDHIKSCIKYPALVTRNKKAYTRKEKHKQSYC